MKTIYLECSMGAAGDMLLAALLELHPDPDDFIARLNSIGLPQAQVQKSSVTKCGIQGTHISVMINQQEECENADMLHSGTTLDEIRMILQRADISDVVYQNTMAVYNLIAEAESSVHGVPVDQVHFHELGMVDAVVDILGVCMLIDELQPDQIIASPIHVGSGHVRCAHGMLPVPAPAAAKILEDVPIYSNEIKGELCTPTGAALLKYFASDFAPMPVMQVEKIGYGMGKKDFPAANCLRAFYGTTAGRAETVLELSCNLDDMTPEAIGFAMNYLLEAGALDVFTTAIGMKKCRPGILLTCLCRAEQKEQMVSLVFQHTTTLGIREKICSRYTLDRCERAVQTPYGTVRLKKSAGYGVNRMKSEFDDLAKIAKEHNLSLDEVKLIVAQASEIQ